ncbi:DUF2630 family protein [Cellulosimicrobium sp. CUA-896]|uniref:DUF2630 family protein n=1 Tax=Cellulosimicrobium sp. CUA-896 TaxID=1517881 RepID=UPI0009606A49|nr:DUF2630 family protein [Cellulosimicrobium sp. CUA-896]OLT55117.1 hypothetical protein BJF88_07680 [Cellulosimicrobium sp. CUA-896]
MTTDDDIRTTIRDLIAREHDLRSRLAAGQIDVGTENRELARAEEQLDQCWDLLRQRDAAREFGRDPGASAVRPSSVVERYLE